MRLSGVYYGWVLVGVLAFTVTVSYGVLMYAFPIVLAPMQAELGWSQAMLTGGFSAAALTAGIVAIPVGWWIDRYGTRVVMTTGSVASVILLLTLSRVHDPLGYYLVWIGLGACMAAVFYEPAFAVVAQWFREQRVRALTIITVAGALASTIFVPITSWLVIVSGWRGAIVWLAATMAVLTILPHALLLRHRPTAAMHERAGESCTVACGAVLNAPSMSARVAFRGSAFRWLGVAFFLSTVANFAVSVHLVPILLARGWPLGFAAAALALLGFAKLPGRLLLAFAAGRMTTSTATMLVFGAQCVGLIAINTLPGAFGVWTFVALFGAGDGASTPARAEMVAELFGTLEYGRITGMLAFILAMARAAAPVGASVAYAAFGGYAEVLWSLCGLVFAAGLALHHATGAHVRPDPACVFPEPTPSPCMR